MAKGVIGGIAAVFRAALRRGEPRRSAGRQSQKKFRGWHLFIQEGLDQTLLAGSESSNSATEFKEFVPISETVLKQPQSFVR